MQEKRIPKSRPNRGLADLSSEVTELSMTVNHLEAGLRALSERVMPVIEKLAESLAEVHTAIVGSTDGRTKGFHQRFDAIEDALVRQENQITDVEEDVSALKTAQGDHEGRIVALRNDTDALKAASEKADTRRWGLLSPIIASLVTNFIMWAAAAAVLWSHFQTPAKH